MTLSVWAKIRAGLIAAVLMFCALEAMPLPTLKKRHLNREVAKDETAHWVSLLDKVGIETNSDDLITFVMKLSKASGKKRSQVVRPWRRLERKLALGQNWGLFTYADPYAGRLVIEGSRGGNAWETLYSAPHDDGSELAELLHYRRVRAIWDDAGDRPHPGKFYNRWVTWIAGWVFENNPEVNVVRVRFDQVHIRPPKKRKSKARQKPEKPMHVRERNREDYQ
ncbi:MAG: hypothetical protein ACPGTU_14240 [Myxococcota bacterium]